MLALYHSGRQADALTLFQQAQQLLAEELGLDPRPRPPHPPPPNPHRRPRPHPPLHCAHHPAQHHPAPSTRHQRCSHRAGRRPHGVSATRHQRHSHRAVQLRLRRPDRRRTRLQSSNRSATSDDKGAIDLDRGSGARTVADGVAGVHRADGRDPVDDDGAAAARYRRTGARSHRRTRHRQDRARRSPRTPLGERVPGRAVLRRHDLARRAAGRRTAGGRRRSTSGPLRAGRAVAFARRRPPGPAAPRQCEGRRRHQPTPARRHRLSRVHNGSAALVRSRIRAVVEAGPADGTRVGHPAERTDRPGACTS
jgi:Bacterial transcriptional activator domain